MIVKSMRLIARGLAAKRLKTLVSGLENLPAEGPALIVARHYHHLYDGLALFAAIPRQFHIVVTLDWVRNRPTKIFMLMINRLARWPTLLRGEALVRRAKNQQTLFSRHDMMRYQRRAVKQSVELLVKGRLLVVFPEGYPNIDPTFTPKTEPEEFLPFKPGFIHIVAAAERHLATDLPIVPTGLCYKPGEPWIAHVAFGAPIYRDGFSTKPDLLAFVEKEVRNLSRVNSALET
jgi:putative membrane protein